MNSERISKINWARKIIEYNKGKISYSKIIKLF